MIHRAINDRNRQLVKDSVIRSIQGKLGELEQKIESYASDQDRAMVVIEQCMSAMEGFGESSVNDGLSEALGNVQQMLNDLRGTGQSVSPAIRTIFSEINHSAA